MNIHCRLNCCVVDSAGIICPTPTNVGFILVHSDSNIELPLELAANCPPCAELVDPMAEVRTPPAQQLRASGLNDAAVPWYWHEVPIEVRTNQHAHSCGFQCGDKLVTASCRGDTSGALHPDLDHQMIFEIVAA